MRELHALLDPTDLIEPRSAVSGSTDLELRESRHLYFKQSQLADEIRAWIDTKQDWPLLVSSIAYKWLDEGLKDRGITRDLVWGVPVDRPGFERKVFYVWFDAPIEYIGATKEWADLDPDHRDWRSWWFDADDVEYTQFMGKDNVPFHTVSFPATIIGSREPWKLVDHIKGFNWLNYYGGKFSTSRGVGVFMDDAIELLPADYWRYYLMANAPESDDSTFTWEAFANAVNKDLADTYGNFVNRCLTFTQRSVGDRVPGGGEPGAAEAALLAELERRVARVHRLPRGQAVPQGHRRAARDLGRRQRLLGAVGAVEGDQGRRRAGRGHPAHRRQPGALFAARAADHPERDRAVLARVAPTSPGRRTSPPSCGRWLPARVRRPRGAVPQAHRRGPRGGPPASAAPTTTEDPSGQVAARPRRPDDARGGVLVLAFAGGGLRTASLPRAPPARRASTPPVRSGPTATRCCGRGGRGATGSRGRAASRWWRGPRARGSC